MCLNFTQSLMNIIRSIDLHNSLQTISIRIVWQLGAVKGILILSTTQGKKMKTNIDIMYNSNCLKSLILSLLTTNERLRK